MASRRIKLLAASAIVAAGAGGYFLYSVLAAQAQGDLAQAPLNVQVAVAPALIIATDDSGSMTYHNQFPGADGKACWDRDTTSAPHQPRSFFITSGPNAGQLRTIRTGQTNCSGQAFAFSYGSSPRNNEGNDWRGIPPVDTFGFARSPDFNPAYFNPLVTYEPWLDDAGNSYGNASLTDTRIDPRPLGTGLGTVDVTANLYGTAVAGAVGQLSDRFYAMTEMRLPTGTEYQTENTAGCGGLVGGGVWNTLASDHVMTASCNVFIKHRLATVYLQSDDIPPGYGGVPRTLAVNACGSGCNLWRYDIQSGNTVALQNFANWFSYYGNRHRSLVAGLTHSLNSINNMRIGYFRISQHGSFDAPNTTTNPTTNTERVHMRDISDPTDKAALFNLVLATPAWSSTFNRQAVYAAGQQFQRQDPLATSTRGGAPIQLACQKNAVMLFTDGYSNNNSVDVGGNIDLGMGPPFSDGHDNTLADIASRYYLNTADGGLAPLRTGGGFPTGQVPVSSSCPSADPRVNCQDNLHVNFYGITLNGRGDLFNPDIDQDAFGDPAIYNNWPAWANDNRSTIDDIWHAATNTRGELVNARTPADITEAMRKILRSIAAGSSSSGSLAMTGARISERSLSVQPGYGIDKEGTDWYGTLAAAKTSVNLVTGAVTETGLWDGQTKLGSLPASTRGGHTWFGNSSGGVSQFNAANVGSLAALCNNPRPGMSLCDGVTGSDVAALGIGLPQAIDYLLGDTSREVRNGGVLRDRTTVLGDIVNSSPVVSAPTDDYGYRTLPAPYGTSYVTYMTNKQSRPAMVYVGANDGMLHAFHGGIDYQGVVDAANAGIEQFAYIPRAVLGHMGNLLFPYNPISVGQKFDHRYYMDGPITVGDAYYGGGFKTVLVAATGAGGRSVFALNVSNPSSFQRLWEIDDQHATAAVRNNIGHVLGKPVIVPFRTTAGAVSWKAIFGNGYNSNNGRAVLYVVDINTGTVRMIEAVESGAPAGPNGLGNIVVVDRRDTATGFPVQDGFADTVYAADQKGALWKFDLLDSATSISTPLFTTQTHVEGGVTYRQPIIGGLTATAGGAGGVMVMFGTGSFSFNGDASDPSIQSIYGVRDTGGTTTLTTSDLFARGIVMDGATTRTITAGAMGVGYKGWYLNLPAGERMVGYPRVASGVLFIPTYAPTAADGCSTGGENWLYGLDTKTGAPSLAGVRFGSITGSTQGAEVGAVAVPTGSSAPVKDVGISVLSTSKPIDPTVPRCWMRVSVPGMTEAMFVPYPCGRQSWRQLQ